MRKKLNEKYLKKLIELKNMSDTEVAHIEADNILTQLLLELGYSELVEAYDNINKWYA